MRATIKIIRNSDKTLFDQEETELGPIPQLEALDRLLARVPPDLNFYVVTVPQGRIT